MKSVRKNMVPTYCKKCGTKITYRPVEWRPNSGFPLRYKYRCESCEGMQVAGCIMYSMITIVVMGLLFNYLILKK